MLKRGILVGRSLGERVGFWDSQRDVWTEVCSMVRVQKGMVEERCLSIWLFGNQAIGECLEREIQEQHWKVGVCAFPHCLQGFAKLFTRQHLVTTNWPRQIQVFPREADLGRDALGCSHEIGSQRL